MSIRRAIPWAFAVATLVMNGPARACNVYDVNCNPPPSDPCSFATSAADHATCMLQLPACQAQRLTGPPLTACLQHGMATTGSNTQTSTSTNTSTSTSTNRAVNYSATMTNTSMFDTQVNLNSQTGNVTVQLVDPLGTAVNVTDAPGTFLTQKDALDAQGNMLLSCASVNLGGRVDTNCATNPNAPECTGMSAALGNGTTCSAYGPPDPKTGVKPCLSYGAYGYTIDEWFVFGQQFFNGMTGCFLVGDKADSTGASADPNKNFSRANRMELNAPTADPGLTVGPGIDGTGRSSITGVPGNVNVSGSATSTIKAVPAGFWQTLAAKYDDGAAYLGLERGDLIKQASSGGTFVDVVSSSPFVQSLEEGTKNLVTAALGNPSDTIAGAKEKGAKMAEAAAGEGGTARDPASVAAKEPAVTTSGGPAASKGASVAAASRGGAGAGAGVGSAASSATHDIDAARALLGGGNTAPAVPGRVKGILASPELGSPEASLFERVTLSYRKHAKDLKAYDESKTARDVRLTEEPAFFKDL
jgi:hypothetical protein